MTDPTSPTFPSADDPRAAPSAPPGESPTQEGAPPDGAATAPGAAPGAGSPPPGYGPPPTGHGPPPGYGPPSANGPPAGQQQPGYPQPGSQQPGYPPAGTPPGAPYPGPGYPPAGYPAGAPGYPAPTAYWAPGPIQPLKTSGKGPRIMLTFGIVCLVLGVLGVPLMVVSGGGIADSDSRTLASAQILSVASSVSISNVRLEGGKTYMVAATRPGTDMTITVRASKGGDSQSGAEVPVLAPDSRRSTTVNSRTYYPIGKFTAPETGRYRVTFSDLPNSTSLTTLRVGILNNSSDATLVWSVIGMVCGVIFVSILAPVGLGLTIGGGVWRSRRNRNRRLVESGAAPGLD